MAASIRSISWTFTVIGSLSIPSAAKTTIRWPGGCCVAGKRWASPIFSSSTTNSLSGEAIATLVPSGSFFDSVYPWGSKPFSFRSESPGAMEPWKASMIPTTVDSFVPNGSEAIASSDPSRRTSSSFTIRTTGIVSSRAKRPCRSSKKAASGPFPRLPSTNYPRSTPKSRRESFPSSVSSAATGNWISLENLFLFPSRSFILISGLKSSPTCIRFNSTAAMNWSRPSLTHYRHGWTQTLKRFHFPLDPQGQQLLGWDLPGVREKARIGWSSQMG